MSSFWNLTSSSSHSSSSSSASSSSPQSMASSSSSSFSSASSPPSLDDVKHDASLSTKEIITSLSISHANVTVTLNGISDEVLVTSNNDDEIDCEVTGKKLVIKGMNVNNCAIGSVMVNGGNVVIGNMVVSGGNISNFSSGNVFNFSSRGGNRSNNSPWLITRTNNSNKFTVQSNGSMCSVGLHGSSYINGVQFNFTNDGAVISGTLYKFPKSHNAFDTMEGVGNKALKINGIPIEGQKQEEKDAKVDKPQKVEQKLKWKLMLAGMKLSVITCGDYGIISKIDTKLLNDKDIRITTKDYGAITLQSIENQVMMDLRAQDYGRIDIDHLLTERLNASASDYGTIHFTRSIAKDASVIGKDYGSVKGNGLIVSNELSITGCDFGSATCSALKSCQVEKEQSDFGTCSVIRC